MRNGASNAFDMTLNSQQPKTESCYNQYPLKEGDMNFLSIRNASQKGHTSALINFDSQFLPTPSNTLTRTTSEDSMVKNMRNSDKISLLDPRESPRYKFAINMNQPQKRRKIEDVLRSNTHPLQKSLATMDREDTAGTNGGPTTQEQYGSINGILREVCQIDIDRMATNDNSKYTGLRRNNYHGSCRPPLPGARTAIRASMLLAQQNITYQSGLCAASRKTNNNTQRQGYDTGIESPTTPQIYSPTSKATLRNSQLNFATALPISLPISRSISGLVQQGIRYTTDVRSPLCESYIATSSSSRRRSSSPEAKSDKELRNEYLYLEQRESRRSKDNLGILVDRILAATKSSTPCKSPRSSSQSPAIAGVEIQNLGVHKRVKIVGFKVDLTKEGLHALLEHEDSGSLLLRRGRSIKGEICADEREGCMNALKRGWTKAETQLKALVSLQKSEKVDLDIYRDERRNRFDREENWDTGPSRRRCWEESKKSWRKVLGFSGTR